MTKNITKILLMCAFAMTSCSQADEPAGDDRVEDVGTSKVSMALSRSTRDEFAAEGISQITVFTYLRDRAGSTLYEKRDIDVSNGEFTMEFPLGENYTTFAVANAKSISGDDTFETVTLHLDPAEMKDVWLSNTVRFSTDKSVTDIDLSLARVVARIDFEPAETDAELAAQTRFDALTLTFGNVASTYSVSTGKAVAESLTFTTDASKGYKSSFYTFETASLDVPATMGITFMKGGREVNHTPGDLEIGQSFGASRRYRLVVPVTYDSYVEQPWDSRSAMPFTLTVQSFPF